MTHAGAFALGGLSSQTLRESTFRKTFCFAPARALRSPLQVPLGPRRSDAVGHWEEFESYTRNRVQRLFHRRMLHYLRMLAVSLLAACISLLPACVGACDGV